MKHDEAVREIQQCAELAHRKIHELHQTQPDNETFSQVGLLDGRDTVFDYLSHNEVGVALEHLLYMIHESDIAFDLQQVIRLHEIAKHFHIRNHYTRDNLAKLGVLHRTFNVPEIPDVELRSTRDADERDG
jgi:hypothetical protein